MLVTNTNATLPSSTKSCLTEVIAGARFCAVGGVGVTEVGLPHSLGAVVVNRQARAGLVFGIASIVVVIPVVQTFFAILGLAAGLWGMRRAKEMNGLGAKAARSGVICSVVGVLVSLLVLWFIFQLPKQRGFERWIRRIRVKRQQVRLEDLVEWSQSPA